MKNTSNHKEIFYTAQEVADMLRINIMTIYRYIKSGKLEAYKIGKDFRIKKSTYIKFLESTRVNL